MAMVATAVAAAVTWVSSAAAATTALVATAFTAVGVSAVTATAISGHLLTLAATSLGSFAINAVFAPRANAGGSPVAFKADPSAPIRGIMGRFGTGGTQNHMRVWGKNNLFISYSVILSLGPIQGIEGFTAAKQPVNFTLAQGQAANVEPYRDKMWMTYKMGTPTDPALGPPVGISDGQVNPMSEWTPNHRTSGYAGAFWTMKNNSKRASYEGGVPLPNWTVLGQKVYDPRKDSTRTDIGGVGAHRWDDWRTWEFSQNAKVHGLNWCLGHHKKLADGTIDRTKLLAGVGASIDKIDLPSWVAGANVSDANGWTISGEWSTQDDKWQVLASMLQAGSAVPVHVGAKIGIMVNAPRASVATITKDDIIGNMNLKVMASRRDRFNTIFPRYINETQGWEYSTAGAVTAAAYKAQDSGIERSKELTYNYVDKSLQAGQLAAYDLANTRETLKVAFPAKPHLLGIKPGDAVTVYSEEHGLNNQKFIVVARPIELMEGTIGFELRSETDSKHAFALGQTDQPAPSPGLTGFATQPEPPEAEAWEVVPRPVEGGGVSQPGLIVGGDVPDGIGGILIEVSPQPIGPWTQVYEGPPTTEKVDITGLEAGGTYYVGLTHKSVRAGVPSERTVLGPFTAPLLVANNSLEIGGRDASEVLTALDGVPGEIDARIEVARAALAIADNNLNIALGQLDLRVDDVEVDLYDPTTGLTVRVGTNETVTADNTSRVTVVEQSINTPTTGLLARAALLETATANLQTGKADASRVTTLEARGATNANRLINGSGNDGLRGWNSNDGTWAIDDHSEWGRWFQRQFNGQTVVGASYLVHETVIPVNPNTTYTLSGHTFLTGLNGGLAILHLPEYDSTDAYQTENNYNLPNNGRQRIKTGAADGFTFTTGPNTVRMRLYIYLANTTGSPYAHMGAWGLKLEPGAVSTAYTDDGLAKAVGARVVSLETATADLQTGKASASRMDVVEATLNTATTGLLARTNSLETATADLQTGKADATRVSTVEVALKTAAAQTFPRDFQNNGSTWTGAYGGVPANRVPLQSYPGWTFPEVPGIGKIAQITGHPVGGTDIMTMGNATMRPNRRYRVTVRGRCTTPVDGSQTIAPAVFMLSQNGGGLNGLIPSVAALTQDVWQENAYEFNSSDHTYADVFQYGFRVSGPGTFQLAFADLEDVTDAVNLQARATTLETATANLQTGKADASRMTVVEARAAGVGWINPNVDFSNWPTAGGTYPAGWGTWSGSPPEKIGIAGVSPWAGRFVTNGSALGLFQLQPKMEPAWYAVTVEATLESGTWDGFGFLLRPVDQFGSTIAFPAEVALNGHPDDADPNGPVVGSGVVGKTYRQTVLVDFTPYPATTNGNLYLMVDGYFSIAAKQILVRHVGVRRATAAEVETRKARGGFASLSARYGSLETATVNLQSGKADASRVTTLEARAGGANLLSKSQFFASDYVPGTIPAPWTGGGYNGAANIASVWADAGSWNPPGERNLAAYDTAGVYSTDGYYDFYSEIIQWEGGKRGVVTVYSGAHRCRTKVIVALMNSAGVVYQYVDPDNADSTNDAEKAGGVTLQDFKRLRVFFTTDAQCARIQVLLRKGSTKAGDISSYAFWLRPMVSEATATQTEAPAWSPPAMEARLRTQEIASVDLAGKLLARWANGTAVPGASTFIYAQSESSPGAGATSDVGIGAKNISLFNEAGGIWTKALEISGGNAILRGGLQAGAFIRLGNGQGWPVALKAVDFNAGDGEVVSFGTDLGALPALSFALNNLAPLTAGETYDVKATNLTATGFTLSAKINVPAVPSSQNATGGNTAITLGGYPGQQIYLDGDPYAADGTYRIRANGYQRHNFQGTGGGQLSPPEYDTASISLQVWAYKAGVWGLVANVQAQSEVLTNDYDSYQNGGSLSYQVDASWSYDEVITLGSGADYIALVRQSSSNGLTGAVYEISDVDWQSQEAGSGVRSATPSGQKTKITVRPQ